MSNRNSIRDKCGCGYVFSVTIYSNMNQAFIVALISLLFLKISTKKRKFSILMFHYLLKQGPDIYCCFSDHLLWHVVAFSFVFWQTAKHPAITDTAHHFLWFTILGILTFLFLVDFFYFLRFLMIRKFWFFSSCCVEPTKIYLLLVSIMVRVKIFSCIRIIDNAGSELFVFGYELCFFFYWTFVGMFDVKCDSWFFSLGVI